MTQAVCRDKLKHNNDWISTWQFFVTFLGWLSDPFKGLSDLQLGKQKGHGLNQPNVGKINTPYMDAMGNRIIEHHQRDWPCLTLSAQKFQTKFQGLTGENLKPEIPNMTMEKQPWF